MFLLRVQEREESAETGRGRGKRKKRGKEGRKEERKKQRSRRSRPRVREDLALGGAEERFKFSPLRFGAGCAREVARALAGWRGGKCLNFSLSKISR